MALRRPPRYSPEEGARFQIHFEKIRQRVEGFGGPFEAKAATVLGNDGKSRLTWSSAEIEPSPIAHAAELFAKGHTVRQVAAQLKLSKSKAGRLRQKAKADGGEKLDQKPKAA